MSKKQKFYGYVNNDEFSLQTPRMIEGDEHETLRGAMEAAIEEILDGNFAKCEIVECQYYGEDGNGWWGETQMFTGSIVIDADNCAFLEDMLNDEDED